MYLCRYVRQYVSPRLLLPSASELLHLVFTQLLTRTCHTSIEILICWAFFPLFVARTCFVAQTILYQSKARSPRISPQASLSAFVNPCCCQSFASDRYRDALCSPNPIALFINNSLVDLLLYIYLFLSISLSLSLSCIFLFILFVLLEEKTHLSRVYLARTNEKVSGRTH